MTRTPSGAVPDAGRDLFDRQSERAPSLWARSWAAFRQERKSVVALCSAVFLVLLVIVAPMFGAYSMNATDLGNRNQAPTAQHWLGTDEVGRDNWTRFLIGGRVSLTVGLVGAVIFIGIGTLLGSIAGYFGGLVDTVIMRFTDVFMCFPTYIIMLIMVAVFKPSLWITMAVIGLFNWPGTCRMIRGQFLSLRAQDFVLAARAVGAPWLRIITRHLLPNVVNQLIVAASFGVVGAIMTETGLSFLGLGVQFPTPSWGNLVGSGMRREALTAMPWMWMPSGLAIVAVSLSVTYVGEGLRIALDPHRVGMKK